MAKVVYRALADASLRAGLPAFMADIAAQPSTCVPDGSVVVTAVDTAHAPLLHAQVPDTRGHAAHDNMTTCTCGHHLTSDMCMRMGAMSATVLKVCLLTPRR